MSYRWRFHPDHAPLQEAIARSARLSALGARLLVNRGIRSPTEAEEFLRPGLSSLSDPFTMSHMERAVERVLAALRSREPIVVYGDSDADGVSGTALLTGFLRAVGANVSSYIPNRLEEGYSLTERGIAAIRAREARLVITVDNGTSATGAIDELATSGIDVIVCDHHEPPPNPPTPLALLNPKWDGCGYPFPYLCGTAVAFQLLNGLASRLPARNRNRDAMLGLLRHSISFVAIATICDCVPLVGENRALARGGLAALQATEHPGLSALLRVASVPKEVQSDDISFRLGPRINAAGRLGQADRALALLLADERDEARALARELDDQNAERQQLEADITRSARRKVEESFDARDPVIVLADDEWHSGVVGIVAARLAGEFDRPSVLVAMNGERGRGSGRSARGFDLYSALHDCSEHLVGFGGHAFAAGLEIERRRFPAFREALLERARRGFDETRERELLIDAEVPLGVLNPSLMHELGRLAPFGEGHANPVFAAPDLRVDGAPRVVGKNRSHLSFAVQQGGVRRKAIGYGLAHHAERVSAGTPFAVAFTPRLNLFRGQADVELDVKDFRFAEDRA
ncbi:MAG: single-stranded-DNA-specific exonuclease RecJ [Planctomycetota bacterium JB042]